MLRKKQLVRIYMINLQAVFEFEVSYGKPNWSKISRDFLKN